MDRQAILQLYGLHDEPFVARPLEPRQDKDLNLHARVEGFGQQVQRIHDFFADAEHLNHLVTALVHGPKGSGRTSVANYLIHCFCHAKDQTVGSVAKFAVEVQDEHNLIPVRGVMGVIHKYVTRTLKIPLKSDLEDLGKLYQDNVLKDAQDATEDLYNEIFFRSDTVLKGRQKMPVVILENVRNYSQIGSALKVFADSPLILFTTYSEDLFRTVIDNEMCTLTIQLNNLTLEDVREFLNQRWQVMSGNPQHPFDEAGVASVFQDSVWSFKVVTDVLADVFSAQVQQFSLFDNPPADIRIPKVLILDQAIQYMKRAGRQI